MVTVLVVDDNEIAVRLCRAVLKKAGYNVLTALDGQGAVSIALANSPDVILLDDAMPGMESREAMRKIKEHRPGVAIVATTMDPSPRNIERLVLAGADEILTPPFRLADLTAVVARLTQPNRALAVAHQIEPPAGWTRPRYQILSRIRIALAAERDVGMLQNLVLTTVRKLTNADAASMWLKTIEGDGPHLSLASSQESPIGHAHRAFRVSIDETSIVGCAVMTGRRQVFDLGYYPWPGKPGPTRGVDVLHHRRIRSVLTVPMRNGESEVVGAIQLVNAKSSFETELTPKNFEKEVISFRADDAELVESIAGVAAVALENIKLRN